LPGTGANPGQIAIAWAIANAGIAVEKLAGALR
jgi:hypothetical protein